MIVSSTGKLHFYPIKDDSHKCYFGLVIDDKNIRSVRMHTEKVLLRKKGEAYGMLICAQAFKLWELPRHRYARLALEFCKYLLERKPIGS